ncbi:MAG: hypothetical protein OXC09_07320 [Truepera sp.]|nr:hypothetical protein [Truepera sp.]
MSEDRVLRGDDETFVCRFFQVPADIELIDANTARMTCPTCGVVREGDLIGGGMKFDFLGEKTLEERDEEARELFRRGLVQAAPIGVGMTGGFVDDKPRQERDEPSRHFVIGVPKKL